LRDAEELVGQRSDKPSGTLRISAMPGYGQLLLMPALQAFGEHYPDLVLDVHLSDAIVDLGRDQIDIAIRGGRQPQDRVVARKLDHNRFILVASPRYLAAGLSYPGLASSGYAAASLPYQPGGQSTALRNFTNTATTDLWFSFLIQLNAGTELAQRQQRAKLRRHRVGGSRFLQLFIRWRRRRRDQLRPADSRGRYSLQQHRADGQPDGTAARSCGFERHGVAVDRSDFRRSAAWRARCDRRIPVRALGIRRPFLV